MVLWPTRSPLMAVILYPCLLLSFIQVGFRGTTTDLSKQTRSVERGLWRMVWGARYWTGNLGVIKVYSDFEEKVDLPRDLLQNTDIECLHLFLCLITCLLVVEMQIICGMWIWWRNAQSSLLNVAVRCRASILAKKAKVVRIFFGTSEQPKFKCDVVNQWQWIMASLTAWISHDYNKKLPF